MRAIKFLIGSVKFRAALAAIAVWVASMLGLDLAPEAAAGVLAAIAAWLGVSGALVDAARVKEREEWLAAGRRSESLAALLPVVAPILARMFAPTPATPAAPTPATPAAPTPAPGSEA